MDRHYVARYVPVIRMLIALTLGAGSMMAPSAGASDPTLGPGHSAARARPQTVVHNNDAVCHDRASSVTARSTSLRTDSMLFVTRLDRAHEQAELLAFDIGPDGRPSSTPRWRAALSGGGNAAPVFAGAADFGYHTLWRSGGDPKAGERYPAFREADAARPPLVLVSTGNGLVHGFHAHTGLELFSHGPFGTTPAPSDVPHQARVAHAWLGDRWATVVAGSVNGSVYLLAIGDRMATDGSRVLWEFRHPAMGSDTGAPSVAPLPDGRFGVIVGSGRDAPPGQARIFVLNAADGTLITEFITAPDHPDNRGHLAPPLVVDVDDDRVADRVYAGDSLGNLWRFDLSGTHPGQWRAPDGLRRGRTPLPLFQATYRNRIQPITARIEAARAPGRGIMVFFGTDDRSNSGYNRPPASVNSFYGLLDEGRPIPGRHVLLEQIILGESQRNTAGTRTVSRRSQPPDRAGWYLDLHWKPTHGGPATPAGERVTTRARVQAGLVSFTTHLPGGDPCGDGSHGWLMSLGAYPETRLKRPIIDNRRRGRPDTPDRVPASPAHGSEAAPVPVIGGQAVSGMNHPPARVSGATGDHLYLPDADGDIQTLFDSSSTTTGRLSWRQLR